MNLRLESELWLHRHGMLAPLLLIVSLTGALWLGASASLSAVPASAVVPASNEAPRLEARLRAFRGQLIPADQLEARQQALLELAQRHGLHAGRIDYGFDARESGRFGVATLRLPLQGRYGDLRRFLAAALVAEPALTLEDLTIHRQTDGMALDARLTFGFLTQLPAGPRP